MSLRKDIRGHLKWKGAALLVTMVMLTATFAGCTSVDHKKNKRPTAVISEPRDGAILNVGDPIFFDGNDSFDPEKKDLTFIWSLGDGGIGTTSNLTHTYTKGGSFNVTLEVNDGKKNASTYALIFLNYRPEAKINISSDMLPIGVNISFDAGTSSDADGDPLTYLWDFGDGNTSATKVAGHTYDELGFFNLTLTVNDGVADAKVTRKVQVYQPNRAPIARYEVSPDTFNNTDKITFNASTSTDADNDTLIFEWDFGDGNTSTGMVVDHEYEFAGSYTVDLNVSDGELNDSTSMTLGVMQRNRAPLAAFNVSVEMGPDGYVGHIGSDISFDASASSDPDGDTLGFEWSFGDGTNASGTMVTHSYTNVGIFSVNLTVSDKEFDVVAKSTMDIFPTGEIFVDWDRSDYGYIVELDDDVEKYDVDANITDETTSTVDDDYHISFINGTHTVRLFSSIMPVAGHDINVTLLYKDRPVVKRAIEVMGDTPMPDLDGGGTYDTDLSQHNLNSTDEGYLNLTGLITISTLSDVLDYHLVVLSSEAWSQETQGTQVNTMKGNMDGTMFNQTALYNDELSSDSYTVQHSTMTSTDSGVWAGSMNMSGHVNYVDNKTTKLNMDNSGEIFLNPGIRVNLSAKVHDIGIEDHDNGDGTIFDCIKIFTNQTIHGYFALGPFPYDHYAFVNETTVWNIRDDSKLKNTDIYTEYVQTVYLINDSNNGKWELLSSESGSFYNDEDGDGNFNPDPAEKTLDDLTEFRGVMPRELRVGDRIATMNQEGAISDRKVVNTQEYTVGSKTFTAARINETLSGMTDLDGDGYMLIVAEGDYTGLPLEDHLTSSYITGSGTELDQTQNMVIKTVQ